MSSLQVGRFSWRTAPSMSIVELIAMLRAKATRLDAQTPATTWYLFGSVARGADSANDTDLLIVYENDRHARLIRQFIAELWLLPPLHLLLMRVDEEHELQFCERQHCVQIYPRDDLSPRLVLSKLVTQMGVTQWGQMPDQVFSRS